MNGTRTRQSLTCLVAGITTLCFAGCSVTRPTMNIGLALYPPPGAEVETTQSYQLVKWNAGSQALALSPRGSVDDMLDLWLSIRNDGEEPVTFFPSHIQYSYCRPAPAKHYPSKTVCTPFRSVPTKEEAAAHLAERERKRKQADNADEAAMAAVAIVFVFALLIVVAAASSSSSGGSSKSGSHRRHAHHHAFAPLRLFADAAAHTSYTGAYNEAPPHVSPKEFVGGDLGGTLADAVISPGTYHAGHIFIPPTTNASLLRLQIGVGSEVTNIEFAYHTRVAEVGTRPSRVH